MSPRVRPSRPGGPRAGARAPAGPPADRQRPRPGPARRHDQRGVGDVDGLRVHALRHDGTGRPDRPSRSRTTARRSPSSTSSSRTASRIVGEVENIGPGLTRDLTVVLKPGDLHDRLQAGHGRRRHPGTLQRSGRRAASSLGRPRSSRKPRPSTTRTSPTRPPSSRDRDDRVRRGGQGGDVEKAKALYASTRMHYERIEPVAESFGDLDPRIDARKNDVEDGR